MLVLLLNITLSTTIDDLFNGIIDTKGRVDSKRKIDGKS